MSDTDKHSLTRRDFVVKGSAGLAATAAAANLNLLGSQAFAQGGNKTLGLGIVGCGGRGRGAVHNCLTAAEALGIPLKLVAVADLHEAPTKVARNAFQGWAAKDRFAVTDATTFVGMDSYKKLSAHPDVDIIIQTTPPGLRYLTLREAVKNGKHSFVEKPVCVDSDTYRDVIKSGEEAKKKGLAIVTGTQYRRENSYIAAIKRLQDGAIGDLVSSYQYYCSATQWHKGDGNGTWDPMMYQMTNWPYFTWLSGDLIAEQSIHNIDAINWSMGGPPVKAYASGGRIARTQKDYGNIYDHFDVHFEWANGVRSSFMGRHFKPADNKVSNRWIGTKGTMDLIPNPGRTSWVISDHKGNEIMREKGKRKDGNNQPYVEEHKALLAGITKGEPVMEIQGVADSSLTCILGRESAYSGRELDFEFLAKHSKLKLRPDGIDDGPKPGPVKLPIPGVRKPNGYAPDGLMEYRKWKRDQERKKNA